MNYLKRRVASQKILQFLQNNKVIFFFQKKSVQSDHWRLLKKKIAKIEGVASLNLKNKRDKKEIQPLILSYLASRESGTTFSDSSTPVDLSMQDMGKGSFVPKPASIKTLACQLKTVSPHSSHSIEHLSPCGPFRLFPKEKEDVKKNHGETSSFLQNRKENPFFFGENKTSVQVDPKKENQLEMVERICGLLYAPNLILGSNSLKKLALLSHQLKEDSNLIFIGGWDGNQLINHLDSLKLLETSQDVWKEGVSCLSFCYARPYLFLHSLLEKRKNLLVYSLKEKMRALLRGLQERKAQQIKEQ